MLLNNHSRMPLTLLIISMLFLNTSIPSAWAYSGKLPKLESKQQSSKICFLSSDGKITYYQKRPAKLMLSSKFTTKEVLSGPPDAFFTMVSTLNRKRMIIEMASFHLFSNSDQQNFLYACDYGSSITIPVGRGTSPKLHLEDSWVSYYSTESKTLYFQSLLPNRAYNKFQVTLKAQINPYFIPAVVMLSDQTILYTDIDNEGVSGIFLLERSLKQNKLAYKGKNKGGKIELCLQDKNLVVGEFSSPDVPSSSGSEISTLDVSKTTAFLQMKSLYLSTKSDPGNIECQNSKKLIYFIQNQSLGEGLELQAELVALHPDTKEVKLISDLKNVTQVLNIDDRILIPFQGDFYIAAGENNDTKDALDKNSSNAGDNSADDDGDAVKVSIEISKTSNKKSDSDKVITEKTEKTKKTENK
ncbi:MAG: hypothetical protein HQK50_01570 [Oligoflexia bacterium]|nr:hypothetical protein [Oligoflexia bacterium]MBF0364226.1 hypothetical protein [Oligoflexia bacterium]